MVRLGLDCDARLHLEDFAGMITQRIAEPLDPSRVAESLKNLYATGRFRELRADAQPQGASVELVFVGRAQYFVGIVRVTGVPAPIEPKGLVTASRLRLGQPLTDGELAAATQRMSDALRGNGYYEARIEPVVVRHPDNQEADVDFLVGPGQPARLSGVEFTGPRPEASEHLATVARWHPGIHLTTARVERGLSKILHFYASRGRILATVNMQKRIYDPRFHSEKLLVRVEPGPLVRVRVVGGKISASKMKELLPVFSERVADNSSLERGRQSLEDYFERQGYFSPSVKFTRVLRSDSQELNLAYTVALGSRGEFMGYAFRGNRTLSVADLTACLVTEPQGFLRGRRVFSRDLLTRNVEALMTLYQSRGFHDVRVKPLLDERPENKVGRLLVRFDIQEGPLTKVGRLIFHGIDLDTQKKIWPSLLTKPGQPYSPTQAQADRDSIVGLFADRGYSHATVTWHISSASAAQEVDIEYRINPGLQERIQRVVVMGNEHTRPGVVRREISLQSGQPLSQSNILESQHRLYDLGIFNQVQIAVQGPQSPLTGKTVLLNVEEARRWTVGYGGGIEVQRLGSNEPQGQLKASPRLSLDLTRLNVGGRGQTVTLRGRLSNLEKGAAIGFLIQHFPTRRDLNLRFNGLIDRTRDVLTFTAEREEASISLEKRYSPGTLLVGRFSFRRVLVDPTTLRISPETIPLFSRPARVAMLGVSYVNDHRDNPADATRGAYSLADAGISWEKLGSESNFLRFSGQNATYHRLNSRLIFARNTRFAVESPFEVQRKVLVQGGNESGQTSLKAEIPLPERFFMGGSESHRGFSINQAGPRDTVTGFPLGGNALFFNSFELRMPVAEYRLSFVLFHDAGNVFSTIRRMRLLKVTQSLPTDFDYAVHALGLGVRYRTPVGPVRFDVGYNLNPPRFQVGIPGRSEVRRLSQLQFFLSIGQSF